MVVVHRDNPERCVATVAAFRQQGVGVRIVIVDNGSAPAARARLGDALDDVAVLPLGANRGFGPAANVGLRWWLAAGEGEWAVVAPHDALPAPGCLRTLVDVTAGRARGGLASPEYGRPDGYGGRPDVDRYFGGILSESPRRPGWEAAGHPHGTLLLARRACLEDIGLFDERYFAYCEEADLGVRARRAGWDVGIVWGAVVRNPGTSTPTAVVDYLQLRNSLLLTRERFGRWPATVMAAMFAYDTAKGLASPSRRSPWFAWPGRWRAFVDFGRGRFGPPPRALTDGH